MLGISTIFLIGAAPEDGGKPDYWFVGKTGDRTLFYFVDASTIEGGGSIRSAWITQVAAGRGIVKHGMRRKMALTLFDCKGGAMFESRIVTYDPFGRSIIDHSYDISNFTKIIAGSIEVTESRFVCSNPEDWPAIKDWTRIILTPEGLSDNENRAFESHEAP